MPGLSPGPHGQAQRSVHYSAFMTTVAVIINPTSGKGKGGKSAPEVGALLHKRGLDAALLVAGSAEEVLEMARAAVADGVDALLAAGGDGTVNLAVQAVAETDVPLGIIPLGTGNDNAKMLGMPVGDLEKALDIIADFEVRTMDVAHVRTGDGTERYFMGVMSAGFDSNVTERANNMRWPKGDLRYLFGILAELGTFKPVPYKVTIDGTEHNGQAMLVAVGNGTSYGGGMQVCVGARPDDGLLMLTWLHEASKFKFLKTFPTVFKGTHVKDDMVEQFVCREIRIEAPGQLVFADGERVGPLPCDVRACENALKVIVPKDSDIGL